MNQKSKPDAGRPPIPTPVPERRRQTRQLVVPLLVFGSVLLTMLVLWPERLQVSVRPGQYYSRAVSVTSERTGVLASLTVTPHQQVRQGDPLGYVVVANSEEASAAVAGMRAEIQLLRSEMEHLFVSPQLRRQMDAAQSWLNWMQQRVELALAKVNFQIAALELQRVEEVTPEHSLPARELDLARVNYQTWQQQVADLTDQVAEAALEFELATPANPAAALVAEAPGMLAPLSVQEAKLQQIETDISPVLLLAPIDGTISIINFRSGEVVTPGSPIILIVPNLPVRPVSELSVPALLALASKSA